MTIKSPVKDYLKNVGQYKDLWKLYLGLPADPLVLTDASPAGNHKVRISIWPVSGHIDCVGTVQVNAETPLNFTGEGYIDSVGTLTSTPTIHCVGLDCAIRVDAITTSNTLKWKGTYTDFPCAWSDKTKMYLTTAGAWTLSIGEVVAESGLPWRETNYIVGDYIRKKGAALEYMIKRCIVVCDLDAVEMYREYMF
jgi:hypothetical protein